MTNLAELAGELLTLVRKDPTHPNAGRFAEAAAHLTVVQSAQEKEASLWEKCTQELPKIVFDLEEKVSRRQEEQRLLREEKEAERNKPKPPLPDAERKAALEKAIAETIAQSIARDLIQEATGLELMAELGRSNVDFGRNVTEGILVRPTLDEDLRGVARERAAELKARAVAVLMKAGVDISGTEGLPFPRPY